MICLGYNNEEKKTTIDKYCEDHNIDKIYLFSPKRFQVECSHPLHEVIEWSDIIMYKYYYRLLQEIDGNSLIVINECLRTQNRHDLTYNCLRLYLQQAGYQIIFQYLPIIDTIDDFMVLFDFDTKSRWKREKFHRGLLKECQLNIRLADLSLTAIDINVDDKTRTAYNKKKRQLIDGIGLKDPHTIPRNLLLVGGKIKLEHIDTELQYVGRNKRFKLPNMQTYRETENPGLYTVFEFCHNFIDFLDFLSVSRETTIDVMVADLKVDQWYFQRYRELVERIHETYSILRS